MSGRYDGFEPVIGLEVHAQLLTDTKLFCRCRTSFGDAPNTHTCPVCLALPGALPVINPRAVELAVTLALSLGCSIRDESLFARKNYFYPDLPKGYQISQYDDPFAYDGAVTIVTDAGERTVRVQRVHMEEDAGKSLHRPGARSVVDLNRAGTPLCEIVSHPDLRSPEEAGAYLRVLRERFMAIGVNDGNLEQGSFRCDANVSVRKVGEEKLGTRNELKNINSFRFVEEAIDIEIRRQIGAIERGERIRQATRGFNADKKETYVLRDKENDAGYRYFPDPDLLPLRLPDAIVAPIRARMPELPEARRARYERELGLTAYAAGVLTGHPEVSRFFEDAVGCGVDAVRAANFVQAEVLADVTLRGLEASFPLSAAGLAEVLSAVEKGTISGKQAKEVYAIARDEKRAPADVIRERGMAKLDDRGELTRIAGEILAANQRQADAYRAGKTQLMGFFVGQVMKATKGSADPKVLGEVLTELLGPATPSGGGAA